jgi:hypothetical protein
MELSPSQIADLAQPTFPEQGASLMHVARAIREANAESDLRSATAPAVKAFDPDQLQQYESMAQEAIALAVKADRGPGIFPRRPAGGPEAVAYWAEFRARMAARPAAKASARVSVDESTGEIAHMFLNRGVRLNG